MCFHNSLSKKAQELANRFNAQAEIDFEPIYYASAFTFPAWPVISEEEPDTINMFRWGLIPHWVKDETQSKELRKMTLNAKSETVFEKPSFKFSIHKKRCLVLSTGFYEWRDYQKKKYPYFIRMKKIELFAMAGIYSIWNNKSTGESVSSFSILTTHSNPLLSKIHNVKERMPVILSTESEREWLNADLTDKQIQSFFPAIDERLLEANTVSGLITSKEKNPNIPEVQNEFDYPELEKIQL